MFLKNWVPKANIKLFSGAFAFIGVNRVFCEVTGDGNLCYTGSTVGGFGFWPKGSPDQYIFAGGLQVGGIVDPTQSKSVNGFAGDTAGGARLQPGRRPQLDPARRGYVR